MNFTIGTYSNAPASYREYDPLAQEVARAVAEAITRTEPSLAVEHIGSTAVPECGGKGVIDLMMLYPSGGLELAKRILWSFGFQRQTTENPFPENRPMRVGTVEYAGKLFRLHVHVICAEAEEAAEMRVFRDRLRAEPEFQAAYEALKRRILERGIIDPSTYAEAKGEFIRNSTKNPL